MFAPMLSVVVPAHDAAPWIGELIESILDQHIDSMELLVVDDRSGDGTPGIVESIAARDSRVVLMPSRAPGGAAARNTGVDAAAGEYLVFADADDIVPSGAYRAMLDSLQRSGSDIVIGDHLKFSPTRTWSPTQRWYPFDAGVERTTIDRVPGLLAGRACWNRMFRRSFWDAASLRFPDVGHADDIEPMTRAVLTASSIDVVPDCIYLYRDRAGGEAGSMSNRSDERAFLEYLREETTCARLVRSSAPGLVGQQSMLVVDADGWVHVDRYFAQIPDGEDVPPAARAAIATLLAELDPIVLDGAAPERRLLFALLWTDELRAAVAFASAARTRASDPAALLRQWTDAVALLVGSDRVPALDPQRLIVDGLLRAYLHTADAVPISELAALVTSAARVVTGAARALDHSSELIDATARAVVAGDAEAVRRISALRRYAPIVIDEVRPTTRDLTVLGPSPTLEQAPSAVVVLRGPESSVEVVPLESNDGRWRAQVDASVLRAGRWTATARFRISTVEVEVPLVTARMPIPPLDGTHLLQPLSDRRDGWRFLVDRRPEPSLARRARTALGRLRGSRS